MNMNTEKAKAGERTHKDGCMGNYDYRDCTCGANERAATLEEKQRTQHTPGPWTNRDDGTNAQITAPHVGNGAIALVYSGGSKHGETESLSNARLIAAAPELLEALRVIVSSDLLPETSAVNELLEIGDAAIAKAEGK